MLHRYDDSREAWVGHLLNSVAARFRRLTADALEPLGLSPPMLRALETIGAHGPLQQTAFGERMRMDRSSIVVLVDRLEALGLVRRARHPIDRRNYVIETLDAATETLSNARDRARAVERDLLAPLSDSERDTLRTLLAKILNHDLKQGADE